MDWGTTNLRAWRMKGAAPQEEATSDKGMGTLKPEGFAPALDALVGAWGGLPVLACGMVGARQGWVEAPYAPVPGPPLGAPPTRAPGPRDIRILPGLSQSDPPDVMRGEETKVAGLLRLRENFDGVVLMPGTHPKWVAVSAGEVTGFRTALTGEAFAALSAHTVLRHSVGADDDWDDAAFLAGVSESLARPEQLLSRLFSLRAAALLRGTGPAETRARLSGLLVGLDLAGAKGWWLGRPVALVGQGAPARAAAAALRAQGAQVEEMDATEATLAGLVAAWERWA